ncbi:LTA synthase family protein [Paenibacillus sp. HB172176]|uniref:LTA synthase family protein n=1 Tax=Paenibacillus sp. HB172176 TaxID=2493690 RepID=UPI001439CBCB|nr:LTA synthase family protein [Paenibacillus sp. HB172176]
MSLYQGLRNRPFITFSIILLLKGALAWFVIFDDGPSIMTMLTEIPFIWLIFCLIEWFATKRKFLYYMAVNLLVTAIYFSALMYYKYYGIVVTYHALSQADKVTKVGESTYSLLDPYYLLVFIDILLFAVVMFRPKTIRKLKEVGMLKVNKRLIATFFVASLLISIFNVLPNHASMNENKKAEEMGILNYELYTLFADSSQKREFVDMKDITQASINELKGIQEPQVSQYWDAAAGKNVIIIQLESIQNFFIGLNIDGQEITPNLNKLAKEDFYFNNFYTSAGAGTTSDAEYVVNTSLYVPQHQPATAVNVDKALPSLPKLLEGKGYSTATFHTNSVEFWNRKELYSAIGFQKYYDKEFYGDAAEDHIAFGADDEVLYAKTIGKLEEMDAADQPFYAQVISMSSHHPYEMPENKQQIKLPERFDDTLVGRYIIAQNYTDYAVGKFIDDLKAKGIWDDSIVMFYGDHQGLPLYSLSDKEKGLMEDIMGREYGYTDMFNIPYILHVPGVSYPAVMTQTGGQIDILPTVANLLGISLDNQIHFGEDLLNQDTNILPMRHFLPTGSFINDKNLYVPGIAYDDGTDYNLLDNSETEIHNGSSTTETQYENALKLLNLSDNYVDQLPDK